MSRFLNISLKSKAIGGLIPLVIILISSFALADIQESEKKWDENRTTQQKMIDKNIEISNWLDGVADGIDLFLVGKRITKAKNETNIKLENSSYLIDGEGFRNASSINVNLRLPNLEEYWQLKFTSYDEKEESRNLQKGYLRQSPREQKYGATIGLFRKLGNVRTSFQPRIALEDPLKVSHSLRFESVADYETYKINPKLELYADASKGPGIYWNLNFNFPINLVYSLTLLNDANYEDKIHTYTANNGFSVGQVWSDTSSLAYNLIFASVNRENYHLDSYTASVTWSQLVYKKILDYQVTPLVIFSNARSFVAQPGIVFTFNLNF